MNIMGSVNSSLPNGPLTGKGSVMSPIGGSLRGSAHIGMLFNTHRDNDGAQK
jgi:hypothetical protein